MSDAIKINSIDELKRLAEYSLECFIVLCGGGLRSSKRINYFPQDGSWDVFHSIDGSWMEYGSDEELEEETNIIDAIENGALYAWPGLC